MQPPNQSGEAPVFLSLVIEVAPIEDPFPEDFSATQHHTSSPPDQDSAHEYLILLGASQQTTPDKTPALFDRLVLATSDPAHVVDSIIARLTNASFSPTKEKEDDVVRFNELRSSAFGDGLESLLWMADSIHILCAFDEAEPFVFHANVTIESYAISQVYVPWSEFLVNLHGALGSLDDLTELPTLEEYAMLQEPAES